jgi:hypothetical protein
MRRHPLPIATDSIAQKLPPHAAVHCWTRKGLYRDRRTAASRHEFKEPGRAKKSTAREGTVTARYTEKIRIWVHFG